MIRTLTALRAKHAAGGEAGKTWGIDGETGKVVDMNELGVWEPLSVKLQAYKTAIEVFIKKFKLSHSISIIFSYIAPLDCDPITSN